MPGEFVCWEIAWMPDLLYTGHKACSLRYSVSSVLWVWHPVASRSLVEAIRFPPWFPDVHETGTARYTCPRLSGRPRRPAPSIPGRPERRAPSATITHDARLSDTRALAAVPTVIHKPILVCLRGEEDQDSCRVPHACRRDCLRPQPSSLCEREGKDGSGYAQSLDKLHVTTGVGLGRETGFNATPDRRITGIPTEGGLLPHFVRIKKSSGDRAGFLNNLARRNGPTSSDVSLPFITLYAESPIRRYACERELTRVRLKGQRKAEVAGISVCVHGSVRCPDTDGRGMGKLSTFTQCVQGNWVTDLTASELRLVCPTAGNEKGHFTAKDEDAGGLGRGQERSIQQGANLDHRKVLANPPEALTVQRGEFPCSASSVGMGDIQVSLAWQVLAIRSHCRHGKTNYNGDLLASLGQEYSAPGRFLSHVLSCHRKGKATLQAEVVGEDRSQKKTYLVFVQKLLGSWRCKSSSRIIISAMAVEVCTTHGRLTQECPRFAIAHEVYCKKQEERVETPGPGLGSNPRPPRAPAYNPTLLPNRLKDLDPSLDRLLLLMHELIKDRKRSLRWLRKVARGYDPRSRLASSGMRLALSFYDLLQPSVTHVLPGQTLNHGVWQGATFGLVDAKVYLSGRANDTHSVLTLASTRLREAAGKSSLYHRLQASIAAYRRLSESDVDRPSVQLSQRRPHSAEASRNPSTVTNGIGHLDAFGTAQCNIVRLGFKLLQSHTSSTLKIPPHFEKMSHPGERLSRTVAGRPVGVEIVRSDKYNAKECVSPRLPASGKIREVERDPGTTVLLSDQVTPSKGVLAPRHQAGGWCFCYRDFN
ncbi:hypothetical protein Bbelb_106130 [Branchiostoma belcheri]|nr:hypothetical protein Bbelb_106130 [Branchiostoma belcheri]